ncbi:uncharacterized protein CTHT_0019670 [Thermochaetoides thermophila DSM 1495]|uniref:Uncharacterized protein n=1 Tax=Chaetomium thermophilum (strain DSM 1495 / CBS 144.50 / IMI 039719) TaxID=759272 RepID=G0S351_CHATD|nr:hypothetical protein CTHT_0019670 [Thermochaetoides thermophila DSM 1495]EGS22434.1 hypothetical protein CTHT_0019670 [Thermochaetoides thermophila DSM 1495]
MVPTLATTSTLQTLTETIISTDLTATLSTSSVVPPIPASKTSTITTKPPTLSTILLPTSTTFITITITTPFPIQTQTITITLPSFPPPTPTASVTPLPSQPADDLTEDEDHLPLSPLDSSSSEPSHGHTGFHLHHHYEILITVLGTYSLLSLLAGLWLVHHRHEYLHQNPVGVATTVGLFMMGWLWPVGVAWVGAVIVVWGKEKEVREGGRWAWEQGKAGPRDRIKEDGECWFGGKRSGRGRRKPKGR